MTCGGDVKKRRKRKDDDDDDADAEPITVATGQSPARLDGGGVDKHADDDGSDGNDIKGRGMEPVAATAEGLDGNKIQALGLVATRMMESPDINTCYSGKECYKVVEKQSSQPVHDAAAPVQGPAQLDDGMAGEDDGDATAPVDAATEPSPAWLDSEEADRLADGVPSPYSLVPPPSQKCIQDLMDGSDDDIFDEK